MNRKQFLKSSIFSFTAISQAKWDISPVQAAANSTTGYSNALRLLRKQLKGTLVLPQDADYLYWAQSVNARFNTILPLAIALCETSEDVSTCIKWSRNTGVPIGTKGGGHNYNGASTTRGLLIATRRMNEIQVDKESRMLTAQSGTLNGSILSYLRNGNVMLPIGTCPQVGLTGLTLGGGIGKDSRWAGLTSDRLRSTELVLANGEIVTADNHTNPDLFWAVRGAGGGNFGIHTQMTYELVELISPVVSVLEFVFKGAAAAIDVFHTMDTIIHSAPERLTCSFSIRTNPSLLNLPDQIAGSKLDPSIFPLTFIQFSYQGEAGELENLIKPLTSYVVPVSRRGAQLSYWDAMFNWLIEAPDAEPRGFANASRYANSPISNSTVHDLVWNIVEAPFAQRRKYVYLSSLSRVGGVVNQVATDETAYSHRNSNTIFNPNAFWRLEATPAEQLQLQRWLRGNYDLLKRQTQPESYQNFPDAIITDWPTAYYGPNLNKLIQVKRKYDPQNVFHHSQSIPLKW